MLASLLVAAIALLGLPQSPTADTITRRYVNALGGEAALRSVRSRLTEGQFDNGRGLRAPFQIYEEAPNRRVTLIGRGPIESDTGSGRGYDGAAGWDKNFIGTGLRTLVGRELAAVARESDLLRPLRLIDECASARVETTADADVLECRAADGGRLRHHFDRRTGLLVKQEIDVPDRPGTVTVAFEDYRSVDGLQLPFRTRYQLPGATVTYTTTRVTHNTPVDKRVFSLPSSK